ncbi:jmjC domain-containing protein 7 isoform X2 [Cephus cinctus]|uniref:Bifunctional peptidase and (3S)-lysyl hydroxylase JMJD7 n=1 Tax=Cephus cinctus TaxID=211228 RepID=A0AAJ7BZ60_CEPCN|nr:jmjC domain-containing protein 7 isoform X2 [Cephus cinctus]
MSVRSMNNKLDNKIDTACRVLSQEASELYLSDQILEVSEAIITPLTFYREYVSKNIPLLIKGGTSQWPAMKKWSIPYFQKVLGDKEVTVAVTPNGYADAIAESHDFNGESIEYFVMPEERQMTMSQFLDHLENPQAGSVFYIQRQNSNFTEDFPELISDVPPDIPWATESFGKLPDAVNIWMGDERAVTSMHKDPYENIYCVISGEKDFLLHPPTDRPYIPYGKYPAAVYKESSPGQWKINPMNIDTPKVLQESESDNEESNLVPWIRVDPLHPDNTRYPKYKNTRTLRVKVQEGDMLYLPSLWFHHVRQSQACLALNYWYDMEYDIKYAYFKALETLCE